MAKRKTVNSRRVARGTKSHDGQSSKYAQKLVQAKQGRFTPTSPFRIQEGGSGLTLAEFNRRRSKPPVNV